MSTTAPRIAAGRAIANSLETLISSVIWGELSGAFAIRKFGEALAVGTSEEDLWNGPGTTETLLTSGATMYVNCTAISGADTQRIYIEGLDENWEIQVGYGLLNNRTQVAIVKSDGTPALWTRIHRGFQESAEPDPVGDVYIAESDTLTGGVPDTNAKVHGYIDFGADAAHQTEKAMYTVPAGHVALLLDMTGGIERASGSARSADVFLEIQELAFDATVDSPAWAPFRRVQELDLTSNGTVWAQEDFRVPFVVGPLTNVHLRCAASASSDLVGSFELVVIPEEYQALHSVHT